MVNKIKETRKFVVLGLFILALLLIFSDLNIGGRAIFNKKSSQVAKSPLSAEMCYNKITFAENLVSEDPSLFETSLELLSIEDSFGNYEGLVEEYLTDFENIYTLETYDSNNKLIKKYSSGSSLFIPFDNFLDEKELNSLSPEERENYVPGGVITLKNSQLPIYIPFDSRVSLIKVFRNNLDGNKKLIFESSISLKACPQVCRKAGEKLEGENHVCCSGSIQRNNFCVKCGDKVCSEGEDNLFCPLDCSLKNAECNQNEVFSEFYERCVSPNVCGNGIVEIDNFEECEPDIDPGKCNSECLRTDLEICRYLGPHVIFDGKIYKSVCEGNNLLKYYCKARFDFFLFNFGEKKPSSRYITCKDGCFNGACVSPTTEEKVCYDDDPANKQDIKGEVKFQGNSYFDECEEGGKSVRQYYCDREKLRSSVKRCPSGTSCIDGKCM